MKLEDFTTEMVLEAMAIYLRHAYPHDMIPPPILDLAHTDPATPLEKVLADERVETSDDPEEPGFTEKYRWRLGNDRYPHMKLGIECCSEAHDFVFNVDTHDRDFPLGSPILEQPGFRKLLHYNTELKRAIEAAWDRAGLPTFRSHIATYLRDQCEIGGERKTVLIVDDDESIVALERALIEEAGYAVATARGGEEALAELERPGRVDLCLLDVMMPNLDGLAVARRMHDMGHDSFPIIYVTALPRDHVRDDIASGYLAKPFDPDRLIEVIRKHLG